MGQGAYSAGQGDPLASIKARIQELETRIDTLFMEPPQEIILPAWDDATPRALITAGNAIAEGVGITIDRIAGTELVRIAANSNNAEINLGSSLTGAPLTL